MKVDPFLDGLSVEPRHGVRCAICDHPKLGPFVDDLLRGMAGEGPYAGKIHPRTSDSDLLRRLKDADIMGKLGLPVYTREGSAFRSHKVKHRAELWARVEAARKA